MQLEHSFSVPVGIDEAWRILLDIERVAPCLPGTSIESVEGDEFTGTVKVKLGPINLTYQGRAGIVEKNEATHHAVIEADGRDARGNGTATATVRATLSAAGDSTTVEVSTELELTGKPAQFSHGVMLEVGSKLIGQFADALAAQLDTDGGSGEAAPAKPKAKAAAKAPAKAPAKKPRPKPRSAAEGPSDQPGPAAAPGVTELETSEPSEPSAPAGAGPDVDPAAETATPDAAAEFEPAAELEPDADEPPIEADPGDTTPAFAAPGGIAAPAPEPVTSVNGHAAAARTPQDVEPSGGLPSVGPIVAKRLAPVAVALVVVLVAVRRRHGKSA